MLFAADKLTLDKPRRTNDGYLVVRAKAARTGVYQYAGSEVDPKNEHGLRDQATVNVLRDEATVFDKKALHSFIGKPITNDHPHEPVTADNWRDHATGVVMGAVRDGEYVAFDLLLTDAATINDVEAGKRELSNGYGVDLEFGDFAAVDGTACQARQAAIRGNHVAVVDAGRAGSECRIADAARCSSLPADVFELLTDERTYNDSPNDNKTESTNVVRQSGDFKVATKTIIRDGFSIEVTDQADTYIGKIEGQLKDAIAAKTKAETDVATLTTDKTTLETKVTALEKQVADAKLSPAQLRDAAKSYAQVADKAKALGVEIKDEMDEPAIMKAAVTASLGDVCKDWTDAQFAASFASLTKDTEDKQPDALRDAIRSRPIVTQDASAVRDLARAAQYN
jgi:hypothetical protein